MRLEKFKMERSGLVEVGQEVGIIERTPNGSLFSYVIEHSIAMSGIYKNAQRIKSKSGVVKEIEETPRGYYVVLEFDE